MGGGAFLASTAAAIAVVTVAVIFPGPASAAPSATGAACGGTSITGATSLVEIPAGPFWMGSGRAERDFAYRIGSDAARKHRWYDSWELLRKRVRLPRYFIDATSSPRATINSLSGRPATARRSSPRKITGGKAT